MLETIIRAKLAERAPLLMTHIVIGYPDFDTSLALIDAMVESGVDLIELQIPFSEPIADGPVILHANQVALEKGSTVDRCFEFAEHVSRKYAVPFLFMTYYNILFRQGVRSFVERARKAGLKGMIVPDLPPEEASEYEAAMAEVGLDPVYIFAPTTSPERMQKLAAHAKGFVYCVARKGVTGSSTDFSDELSSYLARARAATKLPLAVGFGVKRKQDVDFLQAHAEIAVVGSETLRVLEQEGIARVGPFLRGLRA
ncbi:MAG TPA: tryptophan synthase subunit alpha [Polyangiaceae bacterium]|nr:tryptophan synthase subunit alpha [Polyangiaceae bacterium]